MGQDGTRLGHERADASVARRFTRVMKASTSPLGVLTDPALVSMATGAAVTALLFALSRQASDAVVLGLQVLAALPLTLALAVFLGLSGARGRVVAWLARQPFPVENMNAVLNGVGDELVLCFDGALPEVALRNAELDKVHPDSFVVGSSDEDGSLVVRIGVVESKRNPAASNHRRYARFRALVDEALAPLASTHRIATVRVK
jgi:hypothetical protein